ncbi:MAG: glycosyltransferase [Chloroflexota bacterium]
MNKRNGMVAIAWSPNCKRTALFAKRLGASFYQVHYLKSKRPYLAPIKYVLQSIKTWQILSREKPSIIYVAVSPVFAALSVYIYCLFTGSKFIMDVHGNSMHSWKWAWSVPLHRFLSRRAFINIVDQEIRTRLFTDWGARTIVLADPPLNITAKNFEPAAEKMTENITVVNTFSGDEPLQPVIETARQLPDITFYILGDTGLADKKLLNSAPANVKFTGYLLGDDYWKRLGSSSAVMVLTTEPYSLLAGAQEGMALGKPLILSKQPALQDFFSKGAVFIEHSPGSMAAGIQLALRQADVLNKEITSLDEEKKIGWEMNVNKLSALIGETQCLN